MDIDKLIGLLREIAKHDEWVQEDDAVYMLPIKLRLELDVAIKCLPESEFVLRARE